MKFILSICFLFLMACTPKSEPTKKAVEVPMVFENKQSTASKCDQALSAIPVYSEKADMFFKIFSFYENYNECMDAGIAEGMEAVTTTALSQQWDRLSSLNNLIRKDAGFKKFTLNNINSLVTGLTTDVKAIVYKSEKDCPKDFKDLCKEINTAAKRALKAEADDER